MKPRILSTWDLLALAGGCLLWGWYLRVLPGLPDPVPTHFSTAGVANGWTPKAHLPWIVFGMPVYVWLLLLLIGSVSARVGKDPARAHLQAFFPLRGFLPLGFCVLMAAILTIPQNGLGVLRFGILALFLCLAAGLAFLVRDLKAYLRTQPDAQHFRGGGLFYHNSGDPRLWVEKRIGIGWTLNYARPAAWWLTALFLVLPVGAVVTVLYRLSH